MANNPFGHLKTFIECYSTWWIQVLSRKRKFISQPINEKLASQCNNEKQFSHQTHRSRSTNTFTIFESLCRLREKKFNYSINARNDKLRFTSLIVIFYVWTIIFLYLHLFLILLRKISFWLEKNTFKGAFGFAANVV